MGLAETISLGINNPDCSFFVGQSLGQATAASLIVKVTLVYFGVKVVDKIIFQGIPKLFRRAKK